MLVTLNQRRGKIHPQHTHTWIHFPQNSNALGILRWRGKEVGGVSQREVIKVSLAGAKTTHRLNFRLTAFPGVLLVNHQIILDASLYPHPSLTCVCLFVGVALALDCDV